MKRNSKYLWIYSFVVLAVAVILIVYGSLTFGRAKDQNEFNIAARESIAQLSDQNKTLRESLNKMEAENASYMEANLKYEEIVKSTENLFLADELYTNRKYKESAEKILEIKNVENFSPEAKKSYHKLDKSLTGLGVITNN